jgi:hypothetical protein
MLDVFINRRHHPITEVSVKLARFSGTHVTIALLLACACTVPACGGDDTTTTTGTGGAGGGTGGSGGQGGTGVTGGSSGTGGTVGTGGTPGSGGTTGTGGTPIADGSAGRDGAAGQDASVDGSTEAGRLDATPDVRADSTSGDSTVTSDASDAAARSDASDAGVADVAPEAGPGPCPIATDGGDGGLHYTLYSFNPGSNDIFAWSTFNMGPVTQSTDDSSGVDSATSGSLHAVINYTGYGTFPVLEAFQNIPLNLSCFNTAHISFRFTPPVNLPFVDAYITSGTVAPYPGTYTANLLTPGNVADGNWHEVTLNLNAGSPAANKAAILRIGVQLYPATTAPEAGAIPPPVELWVDNVWFE